MSITSGNNPIPFNKPYLTGNELKYIAKAVENGKISGDGVFTKKCHKYFEKKYGFQKCLLTTSCTDALEMSAILMDIQPGDEVIVPSYTFVSTANAFVLRGAKIVFCDSRDDHPGMNEDLVESLITDKTRAIVPVHYAGVACDMDKIMAIAEKYGLMVVEDAAQAIDSYYTGKTGKRPLGSIGHFSTFSFHETKNIISGEGGMLVINDPRFNERAEIIREKGTNRSKFYRGEVDKYSWVDIGSSFLPSDMTAAFLFAQLESLEDIQKKRKSIWNKYWSNLEELEQLGLIRRPYLPEYADNNAHLFYIVCKSAHMRDHIIAELKSLNIMPVFHYLSLHRSSYYKAFSDNREFNNSDLYSERLLRLPFFYELETAQIETICSEVTRIVKEYEMEDVSLTAVK